MKTWRTELGRKFPERGPSRHMTVAKWTNSWSVNRNTPAGDTISEYQIAKALTKFGCVDL